MEPAANAAKQTPERSGARVEARGLTRDFGAHRALDRLDLEVAPGTCTGLLGANGAGKTTFLRMLTGYLVPSEGELRVDGLSPASEPRAVQEKLGFAPETSRLYPDLRVQGSLELAAGLRNLRGAERARAVASALERFDLDDVARRRIGHLSKGFRQRLALAQSCLHDPPLLVVDEPTSGLDPVQRDEVTAVLQRLRGRCTLVLCTHDLDEARALTDRVAILHRGRCMLQGATETVLARNDVLALYRGEAPETTGGDAT